MTFVFVLSSVLFLCPLLLLLCGSPLPPRIAPTGRLGLVVGYWCLPPGICCSWRRLGCLTFVLGVSWCFVSPLRCVSWQQRPLALCGDLSLCPALLPPCTGLFGLLVRLSLRIPKCYLLRCATKVAMCRLAVTKDLPALRWLLAASCPLLT